MSLSWSSLESWPSRTNVETASPSVPLLLGASSPVNLSRSQALPAAGEGNPPSQLGRKRKLLPFQENTCIVFDCHFPFLHTPAPSTEETRWSTLVLACVHCTKNWNVGKRIHGISMTIQSVREDGSSKKHGTGSTISHLAIGMYMKNEEGEGIRETRRR